MNFIHCAAGSKLGRRCRRRTRFQHIHYASAPFRRRGLIFNVGVNAIEQTFAAQFGQFAIEIFAGLAKKLIGGIAEAKHREGGAIELRRFL